jgi:hypothetical protein
VYVATAGRVEVAIAAPLKDVPRRTAGTWRWDSHSGGLTKESDQKLAYLLRLLLVGPVSGSVYHVDPFELRVTGLADVHGTAHGPIGAPVLRTHDGLSRNINRAARVRQLLGDGWGEVIVAPATVFLQGTSPAAARVFLPIDVALRLG